MHIEAVCIVQDILSYPFIYLFITYKMHHKKVRYPSTANNYRQTIQSSKIKAVRLTKASKCQLITDNLQYFQISK